MKEYELERRTEVNRHSISVGTNTTHLLPQSETVETAYIQIRG